MSKLEIPRIGARIPSGKFHVSKSNVRYTQGFGESEKDKILIRQIAVGKKIVEPFRARLEGDGYGVFMGRRRFLAKKTAGAKEFIVGDDVLIEQISEDDARQQSLIENLTILREQMDPITRAKQLNEILSLSPGGIRVTARRLGLTPSTLSEWLKPLELTEKMQQAVGDRLLYYTDALRLAKMKIGTITQDQLADTLRKDGLDAFQAHLARLSKKKLKRGFPKDKYFLERVLYDKHDVEEMETYKALGELAKAANMKTVDYMKKVLADHVASVTEHSSAK